MGERMARQAQGKKTKAQSEKKPAVHKDTSVSQVTEAQKKPNNAGNSKPGKQGTALAFMVWVNCIVVIGILLASYVYVYPIVNKAMKSQQKDEGNVNRFIFTIESRLKNLEGNFELLTEKLAKPLIVESNTQRENKLPASQLPESLANEEVVQGTSSLSGVAVVDIQEVQDGDGVENTEEKDSPILAGENAIVAGLSEISDRTVLLEEKVYQLSQLLEKTSAKEKQTELVLAVVRLKEVVMDHKPFAHELAQVKQLIEPSDAQAMQYVAALEPFAEQGIVSFKQLEEEFQQVATKISLILRGQKENPNLTDQFLLKLPQFIQVRKIEADHNSITDEDILARTHQHIEQHDIEAAVSELSTLYGKQGFIAQQWLDKAKAYTVVKHTVSDMFSYFISSTFKG